jgi:hypothetical protein
MRSDEDGGQRSIASKGHVAEILCQRLLRSEMTRDVDMTDRQNKGTITKSRGRPLAEGPLKARRNRHVSTITSVHGREDESFRVFDFSYVYHVEILFTRGYTTGGSHSFALPSEVCRSRSTREYAHSPYGAI